MGSLKPGWRMVKFGDVVRQCKEKADPETSGLERYVAGEHMDTNDLRIRRWGEIGSGYLGPAFHMRFKPRQVLYGSRRTYLRKVAVADFDGICANTTFVLEPKDPKELLLEFLPFLMQTDAFNDFSIKNSKGSVNPYINFSDLAKFEFALPPVEEQKHIAILLNSIYLTQKNYEKAHDISKKLLFSFISKKIKEFQEKSKLFKFNEVCSKITDGTHQPPKFSDSGIPFLLISNLSSGKLDWAIEKWITEGEYQKLTRHFQPQKEDILLTLVGSYGIPIFVDWDKPFAFQRHIGILRSHGSKLRSRYLYYFLCSPFGQWQCTQGAEGLAQKTITLKTLKDFKIPLPSLEEQDIFIEEANNFLIAIQAVEKRKKQSKEFFCMVHKKVLVGWHV